MIKLNRLKKEIDGNIDYIVLINGVEMGKIKNGDIIDFKLRLADNYSIQVKSEEFVSNVITFNMNENQIIEFVCYPNYKNTFFSKLLHRTILEKVGIKLEIRQDIYL